MTPSGRPVAPLAAILLAAGSGSRFGGDKLSHLLEDGVPMAVACARRLRQGMPDALHLAVVRPRADDDRLAQSLQAEGFKIVVCPDAAHGMGHSLAEAIRAANATAAAVGLAGYVIALGDMPFIEPATIAAVARAVQDGAGIAAPTLGDRRGHPVGLAARFGAELLGLRGDAGARDILRRHAGETVLVATSDVGVVRDVDTPDDLIEAPGIGGQTRHGASTG